MKWKWWEEEAAFYCEKLGIDPEEARIATTLRWMYHNDFRPLAAIINAGQIPDKAVLNLLAELIDKGRLQLVQRKRRGRPKSPEAGARRIVVGRAYEEAQKEGFESKEVFEKIAEALNMSEPSVRQMVTAWRKAERQRNNK